MSNETARDPLATALLPTVNALFDAIFDIPVHHVDADTGKVTTVDPTEVKDAALGAVIRFRAAMRRDATTYGCPAQSPKYGVGCIRIAGHDFQHESERGYQWPYEERAALAASAAEPDSRGAGVHDLRGPRTKHAGVLVPVPTAEPLTARDAAWEALRNHLSKAYVASDIDAALATARPLIEAALRPPTSETPPATEQRVLEAMASWPKGSNGPVAIAAYEALVRRLLARSATSETPDPLPLDALRTKAPFGWASLASTLFVWDDAEHTKWHAVYDLIDRSHADRNLSQEVADAKTIAALLNAAARGSE